MKEGGECDKARQADYAKNRRLCGRSCEGGLDVGLKNNNEEEDSRRKKRRGRIT